ncbi:hypothetical protein NEMBOFW57_002905 [Staphylotrichum longicolle]|uniref:BZIP domain-containing protein n=1 Tax=Staphylotrichum longicolle TaxID=669026 RepID=A0AAD4I433_9PEZI|nr:hypothetical protein NEMBOFW57_002905 [Staphylotrichum longicolle]
MRYPFAPTDSDWVNSFSWTHWQDDKTTEGSGSLHRLTDDFIENNKDDDNFTEPPKPKRTRSQKGRGTITRTTTAVTTTGKTATAAAARNRAAASRYRAKTQAAFAQLEAAERDVTVRHQSLLACARPPARRDLRPQERAAAPRRLRVPAHPGYLSHAASRRGGAGGGRVGWGWSGRGGAV